MSELPQLSEDGTPHFAYFDHPTQLSFVWDGKAEYIEVSRGGYGEPVIATIGLRHPPAIMGKRQALDWLDWFQVICRSYLEIRRIK